MSEPLPPLAGTLGSADGHAVRWATRSKGRAPFQEPRWTKWHATSDDCQTRCGLPIIIATSAAFTPETDDESRVDCHGCLQQLNAEHSHPATTDD